MISRKIPRRCKSSSLPVQAHEVCEGGRVWTRLPEGVYSPGIVTQIETKLQIRLDEGDLVSCDGCDVTSYVPDVKPHPAHIRHGARVLLPLDRDYSGHCGTVIAVDHSTEGSFFLVQLDNGEEVWELGSRLRLLGGNSIRRKGKNFHLGEEVLGKWWNGIYYEGNITGIGPMIEVTFPNGEIIKRHPLDQTAAVKHSTPDPELVRRGSRVIAQPFHEKGYFSGTVIRVDHPRYLVLFDIGEEEWKKIDDLRVLFTLSKGLSTGESIRAEDFHCEDIATELNRLCAELDRSDKHFIGLEHEFSYSTQGKHDSFESRLTFTEDLNKKEIEATDLMALSKGTCEITTPNNNAFDSPSKNDDDEIVKLFEKDEKTEGTNEHTFNFGIIKSPDEPRLLGVYDRSTTGTPELLPLSVYEEILAADNNVPQCGKLRPCSEDWSESDSHHSWHSAYEPADNKDNLFQSLESYHSAAGSLSDVFDVTDDVALPVKKDSERHSQGFDEQVNSSQITNSFQNMAIEGQLELFDESEELSSSVDSSEAIQKLEHITQVEEREQTPETVVCSERVKYEVLNIIIDPVISISPEGENDRGHDSDQQSEDKLSFGSSLTQYMDGFVNIDSSSPGEIDSDTTVILDDELTFRFNMKKSLKKGRFLKKSSNKKRDKKETKQESSGIDDWVLVCLDKPEFEISEARRAEITRKIYKELEPECCLVM